MAYYDVLAASSYGRYNRKLVKMTNLQTAVYWSELLDIISRVVEKKTFDDEGYFKLNRTYIEDRTGLSKDEQLFCDSILSELKVLDVNITDQDRIKVKLDKAMKLLTSDSITIVEKAKKKVEHVEKRTTAEIKRAAIFSKLLNSIATMEADQDLRTAYNAWLEVVYDKGICKIAQIKLFIDGVNKYTADKTVKLDLIHLATTLGYREVSWVINKMNSTSYNKTVGTKINIEQKTSTGFNQDISF